MRQIQEKHRLALGVETLRPWDTAVDPLGRPPLVPFKDVEQLAAGTETIFRDVNPELGEQFAFLREHKLLDLANRKGKAPGGYQTTFEDRRLPFIFMNAVGLDSDVRTLLHEGGHAFHTLACRGEPLSAYRESPLEFCEVASMTMELLGARRLDPFYGPADADRSNRKLLEGIVLILPWIATVDAFQHWIYSHPDHTREERKAAWRGLLDRFGGSVDWSGHEDARDHSWHRQLHIFLYPFYYIEYGIAQLGALQIWQRSLHRPAGGRGRLQEGTCAGRLSAASRAFRRGRHQVRFQRSADRLAHGHDRGRARKAQPVTARQAWPRIVDRAQATSAATSTRGNERHATSEIAAYSDESRRADTEVVTRCVPEPSTRTARKPAIDGEHGLLRTVVDSRQPAGDRRFARSPGRRCRRCSTVAAGSVPRNEPCDCRVRPRGDAVLGQEPGHVAIVRAGQAIDQRRTVGDRRGLARPRELRETVRPT